MRKIDINVSQNRVVNIEYDDTKYEIEFVQEEKSEGMGKENLFLLRRISDNKIIKVFSGKIKSIIQCNNNFVTIGSVKTKVSKTYYFNHYVDDGGDKLVKKVKYECSRCERVGNNTFLLGKEGKSGNLYNLKNLSKVYSGIYKDESVSEIMGKNAILVSEEKYGKYDHDIKDTITYGIDLDTYDIKTSIWSELQQRYIPILTSEECSKREILYNMRDPFTIIIDSVGHRTIELEVQRPLNVISNMLKKESSNVVDRQFVKGFNVDVYL